MKYSWLPFISVLAIWIICSFFLNPFRDPILLGLFLVLGTISFFYIVYRIVVNNKKNASFIFFKLAKLPFLIIGSHILLMLSVDGFSGEGGWWILYFLVAMSIPISLLLYIIGLVIEEHKHNK